MWSVFGNSGVDVLLLPVALFAIVGCGLVGGLLFAFSNVVMGALGRLPVQEGIAAMQDVNARILNPLFFVAFLGTALACVVLLVWSVLRWPTPGTAALAAGAVLYLVGCFGVTAAVNVPMNDRLARVEVPDPAAEPVWRDYVARWTRWNHVRTVAALAAAALLILGLVRHASAA